MSEFYFSLQRLLNQPLFCTEAHAAMVVAAIHGRFGINALEVDGLEMDGPDMMALAKSGRERPSSASSLRGDFAMHEQLGNIGYIPVRGSLTKRTEAMNPYSGMTGYNRIMEKVATAIDDPKVKGIMLDVDSGGGEAAGMIAASNFIYQNSIKGGGSKPIFAMANSHAYSAAYGLLSAADRSFVPPDGGAGSVGVLALIPDRTKQGDKGGTTVRVMRSGVNKARVNPYEAMDEETTTKVQAELDQMRDMFAMVVARNIRPKGASLETTKKKVLETEGESYMGELARTVGLVTDVGFEQDAWDQLQQEINR
jgi:ClpP class serine protease